MMTGAPQHIEIFVTHVAEDGALLKIWGQLDRSAATFVERLILQYTEQFERGIGAVYSSSLSLNQLCCAKYGEDGVYYRARISDMSAAQQGYVGVRFIDYGNSDVVEIANIRSLHVLASSPLSSIDNQATEFTLAGVVPPMGISWDPTSVDFIREKLCYAEFRCAIVAQICGRRLITLYYRDTDFSEILIQKNLAIRITLHAQQAVFHNLQYQYNNTASYNFSIPPPPPPVPVSYPNNANMLVKTAAITKQESGVISAPVLSVGSKHTVYISYVEDGPFLFSVQLKSTEAILQNMTQTFSHAPLKPFSQSPIPGSACVSLLPQAKVLCRAVVTNLMEKECVVYCVDFGNTETVPFTQIYELPPQFLHTKSLAMRFCLAGIQNTMFDDKVKRFFQKLVTGETLSLEVVEPEGPPLKQYGNIYLSGKNIVQVLKEKQKDLEKSKSYPQLPTLQPGRFVNVTVSYVESVDNFYVQYDANTKALAKIMSTMVEYCTTNAPMIRLNELNIGMPVCALFSVDQQWYRAKILSVTGDQITVFYVDYGNTDTVNLASLRQMDSNLLQAQAQAVACCLHGFENVEGPLEDLSNRFEELTLERKLTMKITDRTINGKIVVELHDATVAPVVNIGVQLLSPAKPTFAETPIDEWHDPAASGEPAAHTSVPQFGKERNKQEDGGGEGWRTDSKRGGGWNESRESSKKWGTRDDKHVNDKKWNRSDQSGEQKRWGKEDRDGNGGWENREERSGNKKWDGNENRNNSEKNWEKRSFNKDSSDWKENKRFVKTEDDWDDKDNNKRGFNKSDDWKSRDNNKRGFGKEGDDWKDNKRGFEKDGEEWKDRGNNRRFNKDGEDRNWRKRDDQGQSDKKWWGHDDRGEPEKKWGSSDRQDGEKKWGAREDGDRRSGRDKRSSNAGGKWNGGDRGLRKNMETWKDQSVPASTEQCWDVGNDASKGGDEDWGNEPSTVTVNSKIYPDPSVAIGTKENVTLVSADDPTSFVVQVDNKIDELTKMMESIASVYDSGGTAIPDSDKKVSSPCITRYSEDNAWYRAIITSPPNEGTTEVRFVDYGNQEAVPSSDVMEVVPEFLSIPLFGIPCSLFSVQIPVEEWSQDQITEFLNVADGKKLEAHFIKKDGPLFEVVLFDLEEPSVSINEKFGASKASIEEGMTKKSFQTTVHLQKTQQSSDSLKHMSASEVVYASSDNCFSVCELSPEMTDDVSVTWFINPDQFYCQRSSTKTEFASMVNDIQTAYVKRPPFKGELSIGYPIIAQFPADKVLYRAEIKDIKGLKYQVQYVDYGNMELLATNNIWQIEKRFLELPKQAVECSLGGIKPVESEWPKECAEFDRLFGAETLQCTFHDTRDGKNYVSLSLNGKDIAEELVLNGLAVRKVEERVVCEEKLALKLLKGQQIPAHVSFIESVSKFFVHLDPVVAKDIQDKVNKHMLENKDETPIPPADMVEHQMCLATPDGNQWFRGKIIDTSGTVGVCVRFIDFGDSDDIPVDRIRPIPEALMGLRHRATECFVAGSDKNEGNKEFEDAFKLEVEAQDVIIYIEDVINERLSVHLFDIEGQRLELLDKVDRSSPLEIEPLCPMPILVHTVRMWVSHVDKLNEIWFQKESEGDILSGLLELLYNFYEEEAKGVELGDPHANPLCAAKSAKDGSWYRAKVRDVIDEQINVVYIDYGNSETLSKDDVKELDPSFYRVHALATCASLVVTVQDVEKCLEEFQKITLETVFDVSFVKDAEEKWSVHMENDEINVIHHLVKAGLVSEVDSLFLFDKVSLPLNEKIDVSISHFESCSEFWVQMDSNFLDILELQSTLQYISPSQAVLIDADVNALCVAQFSDEAWYRAKIVETSDTIVKVQFLDYGNTYETDAKSLRKLPIKFFRWPYFAVRCRLANELFLEDAELAEKCSELLSATETVFQLQVVEGNDPALVSLFVGEKELERAVIEKETKIEAVSVTECVEATLSESETVFVSHVSSPAKFWIQKESASSELQDLADILILASDFEYVSEVQVGSVYAALFEDDEQWYRAKILEILDDTYNVLFVDYGNSSVVSDLRVLPEALVHKPIVAKCCRLEMPVGVDCWSAEADSKFVELTGEGTETFLMTQLSNEEPFEVKLTYNGNDVSSMLGELSVRSGKTLNDADLTATITHINNPCEFWINWETESSKREMITDKLVDAENFDPLEEFSEGTLCVSLFPEDEQWYRSKILSCQEEGIEVLFIDYGNTALVTDVQSIPQDLASIPPLAKCCSLPLPKGLEKWPERAEEEFINIFGDGTNTYKVTVIQEGDPSVISLEINGSEIVDKLRNCCDEGLSGKMYNSDELSYKASSPEVEIISETEIIELEEPVREKEQEDLRVGEIPIEFESHIDTCEVAKDILEEVLESVSVQEESELVIGEEKSNQDEVLDSSIVPKVVGEENSIVNESESSDEVLKKVPNPDDSREEYEKALQAPDVASQVLNELIETSICSEVTADYDKESQVPEKINATSESIDQENFLDDKTDLVVTKINNLSPKHGMEHCEKIIRDFSVEMQMPGKDTPVDGSPGGVGMQWCGSPVRKLSHAERIVPGSISRGMSPVELETSPDCLGKELHEKLASTLANEPDVAIADIKGSLADETRGLEIDEAASDDKSVSKNNDLTDEQEMVSDTHSSDETKLGIDGLDKNEEGSLVAMLPVGEVQENATICDSKTNSEEDLKLKKPLMACSPQKTDNHNGNESIISDNVNPALDTSESVSSSLQKDIQSTEIEAEVSGDISGSLYEDSDSPTNDTLNSSSFAESSKQVTIDENKMKCYEFAQMHTSEEQYESSKCGLIASAVSTFDSDTTETPLAQAEKSLVEERRD